MNESHIEKKVCEYAKSKGWLTYKFVSPSNRGVPDRLFLRKGNLFFIEFKAPGKIPTKLQSKIISKIKDQGFLVYVVDDIESGKSIVNGFDR
jgi:hypothetical protein